LNRGKNILICPLEWGLGHAARMIPVARLLREMDNNIFIASGEEHLAMFRTEMPGVTCIEFAGFRPGYSRYLPQYFVMLLKTPLLLYHIVREHLLLKKIISKFEIDIVISDNRFGLWNRNITSAYFTHMPRIPFPKPFRKLEFLGILLHSLVIKRYSFCFIPDLPGDLNLSGRLSHGFNLPDNVRYTGILSRFISDDVPVTVNPSEFPHHTVILSGPEPQRGILKLKLVNLLWDKLPATVILEGRPDKPFEIIRSGNICYYTHLPTREMKVMIQESKVIICRPGYTTLMDLISLNCRALIIPTPGQTEQEYLAEYLSEKGWFNTISQGEIKEGVSLPANKGSGQDVIVAQSRKLLEKALKELLEEHHKRS